MTTTIVKLKGLWKLVENPRGDVEVERGECIQHSGTHERPNRVFLPLRYLDIPEEPDWSQRVDDVGKEVGRYAEEKLSDNISLLHALYRSTAHTYHKICTRPSGSPQTTLACPSHADPRVFPMDAPVIPTKVAR